MKPFALALALLLLAAAAPEAGPKTAVTVTFELQAYRDQFDAGQIAALQQRAAERIAGRLDEHVPFLDFTTGPGSPFTLSVILKPRSAPERPGAPGEVGFHFTLTGPRVAARHEYATFRPAHDLNPVPLLEAFIAELDVKLPEEAYRGRLRPLLREVPIARSGRMTSSPAGWVLPHRRSEICLDFRSQLRIEHVVKAQAVVSRLELAALANGDDAEGQIFGSPVNPAEFQKIGALPPDQVAVDTVWVTDYLDLVPCSSDFAR